MNFSGTKCDECGRIKGASNHWHQLGILRDDGRVNIEIGDLRGPRMGEEKLYEVHDLCGAMCFYKHIGKLLGLISAAKEEE